MFFPIQVVESGEASSGGMENDVRVSENVKSVVLHLKLKSTILWWSEKFQKILCLQPQNANPKFKLPKNKPTFEMNI